MRDEDLQAVPIDELMKHSVVVVDTYIRLSSQKFVLIAKGGSGVSSEILQKYKAKNVASLFVAMKDYRNLLVPPPAPGSISSGQYAKNASFGIFEKALTEGYREANELSFDEALYSQAKIVNHSTLAFVMEQTSLTEHFLKLDRLSSQSVKHAVLVSMISVMMGADIYRARADKATQLELLGLGAFLHDLGKSKLPAALVAKDKRAMNRDERVIYQSHCEVGRMIASQIKGLPDEVLLMIFEHHERSDGSGFPRGLIDGQISPYARIVAVANEYVERLSAFETPRSPQVARTIIDEIELNMPGLFNVDALGSLKSVVKSEKARLTG